jgi:proteasome accessory factor C
MARSSHQPSTPPDANFNQNRLHRLLQLIRLLRGDRRWTIRDLGQIIGSGDRTVYRYLRLLESLGFAVLKDEAGAFYIAGDSASELFTPEEASLVLQALHAAFPNRPEVASISAKLKFAHEQGDAAQWIAEAGNAVVLRRIGEALEGRRRLLLHGYASANSGTVRDRVVEPLELVGGNAFLAAYEVADGTNKYFRIDRIAEVTVLEEPMTEVEHHRVHSPDVFGFALDFATADKRVQVDMSAQAALFLKAEAPLTGPHLVRDEGTGRVKLNVLVADYRPAVRFVLPFLNTDAVRVLGDARFAEAVEAAQRQVGGEGN